MPIFLDHMTVPVHDSQESLDFYTTVFGAKKGSARGRIVGVWLSDTLELQLRTSESIQTGHYAFRLETDEFEVALGQVKGLGLPFGRARDKLDGTLLVGDAGEKSVFFNDPNGHELEMIVRPPSQKAAS